MVLNGLFLLYAVYLAFAFSFAYCVSQLHSAVAHKLQVFSFNGSPCFLNASIERKGLRYDLNVLKDKPPNLFQSRF